MTGVQTCALPIYPERAAAFGADSERAHWHDASLWLVRTKRDAASRAVPEWEALREAASQIKAHTLDHLGTYLEQFEAQATARGAHVHWARDAAEHNRIVSGILADHGVRRVVQIQTVADQLVVVDIGHRLKAATLTARTPALAAIALRTAPTIVTPPVTAAILRPRAAFATLRPRSTLALGRPLLLLLLTACPAPAKQSATSLPISPCIRFR